MPKGKFCGDYYYLCHSKTYRDYYFPQKAPPPCQSTRWPLGERTTHSPVLCPTCALHLEHDLSFPLVTHNTTNLYVYFAKLSAHTLPQHNCLTQEIHQDVIVTHTFNILYNSTKILLETPEISDLFSCLMPYKWKTSFSSQLWTDLEALLILLPVFLLSTFIIKCFLYRLGHPMPYSIKVSL